VFSPNRWFHCKATSYCWLCHLVRGFYIHTNPAAIGIYEGVSKSFRTESITKYTLTTINTRWEATQRVMAAKLARLTHKIAIQLHLVAQSCTICSSHCSRRPVRRLFGYTVVYRNSACRKANHFHPVHLSVRHQTTVTEKRSLLTHWTYILGAFGSNLCRMSITNLPLATV
jgi:hypothetical protein